MPIYEYECGRCRRRFEKKQGFDDAPQAECPECHGEAKRVFLPAPVIFKGSGFYVTDHRTTKDSYAEKKETKAGGETKTGGESKIGAGEKGK